MSTRWAIVLEGPIQASIMNWNFTTRLILRKSLPLLLNNHHNIQNQRCTDEFIHYLTTFPYRIVSEEDVLKAHKWSKSAITTEPDDIPSLL